MTFIDHFTVVCICITDIYTIAGYNEMYIKSMFLWMSIPEAMKQKNDMGITNNMKVK